MSEGELIPAATCKEFLQVAAEGEFRQIETEIAQGRKTKKKGKKA